MFFIDLVQLSVRSNNVSEARNSAFSKEFSMAPTKSEISDHLLANFKRNLIMPRTRDSALDTYGELLLGIQKVADRNLVRLLAFFSTSKPIKTQSAKGILARLSLTPFKNKYRVEDDSEYGAVEHLDDLLGQYQTIGRSRLE